MTWLIFLLLIQSSPSFALQPQVDDKFISSVLNKSVFFSQKKSEGTALPNCVAATLRAGGYLPVFAGSSTKDFYTQIIPLCFESADKPRRGDVGVLVYNEQGTQTLAHVVLFLDSDKVLEKPSPEYEDKFRFNTWEKIKARNPGPHLKFETYTFKDKPGCPLGDFYQFFQHANEAEPLRRLNQATEQRLKGQNWRGLSRTEKKILKNVTQWSQSSREIRTVTPEARFRAKIGQEMLSLFWGLEKPRGVPGTAGVHDDMVK